jgi:acyl-CoA synthetase (AMP-forming)/AMP-acid ligase II
MANFAARISDVAGRLPSQPAIDLLRADGAVHTTTYGELEALAGRIGGWLVSVGIGEGDRVAILADNDANWIAAYLGVLRIGAVAVPLDTAYKAAQVGTVLESSGARVLFTTPRYLDVATNGTKSVRHAPPNLALLAGEAPGVTDASAFATPRPFHRSRRSPAMRWP